MNIDNEVASNMESNPDDVQQESAGEVAGGWLDIFQVRLNNLDQLVAEAGSAAELARRTQSDPSYISQIRTRATYGRGVTRRVGEKFARRLEQAMGKPRGWMDSADGMVSIVSTPSAPAREGAGLVEAFKAGVYRHYKGQHYLALGLARADETDEVVVVYTRLYARPGLPMSTRLWRIWNESVEIGGESVPRFAFVGHHQP